VFRYMTPSVDQTVDQLVDWTKRDEASPRREAPATADERGVRDDRPVSWQPGSAPDQVVSATTLEAAGSESSR
jgi:hypothetical protein